VLSGAGAEELQRALVTERGEDDVVSCKELEPC
jgi:hypothetical protein